MKYRFFLLAITLMFHAVAGCAYAGASVKWDTGFLSSITNNSHPAIHGNTLVWQARGGLTGTTSTPDDLEIFVYDITLRTVTQLTDDGLDDIAPKTDGTYIVWQKNDTFAGNQIFLYQLHGTIPLGGMQISTNDGVDLVGQVDRFSPDIAEGVVIWSRQQIVQDYHPREILLYNANTQTGPQVISNPDFNSSMPRISGNLIVFQQANQQETKTLFLYDVNDEPPALKSAPDNFIWYANPQVDGDQTVLSRYIGTDREIFLHSPSTGYTQLTHNDLDDTGPIINQSHIAWTTGNDIFLAEISSPETANRFLPFIYLLLLK